MLKKLGLVLLVGVGLVGVAGMNSDRAQPIHTDNEPHLLPSNVHLPPEPEVSASSCIPGVPCIPWCRVGQDPKEDGCRNGSGSGG